MERADARGRMKMLQRRERVVGGSGRFSWGRSLGVLDRGSWDKESGKEEPQYQDGGPTWSWTRKSAWEGAEASDGIWGSWEDGGGTRCQGLEDQVES